MSIDDRVEAMIENERRAIAALERVEYMTATNQGTYGAVEACRKVGCGDPAFANRNEYETVGGSKRSEGPDLDDAPGYMRQMNREALSTDRTRLVRMRKELYRGKRGAR